MIIGAAQLPAAWVARAMLSGHTVRIGDPPPPGLDAVLVQGAALWGRLFQAPLPDLGAVEPGHGGDLRLTGDGADGVRAVMDGGQPPDPRGGPVPEGEVALVPAGPLLLVPIVGADGPVPGALAEALAALGLAAVPRDGADFAAAAALARAVPPGAEPEAALIDLLHGLRAAEAGAGAALAAFEHRLYHRACAPATGAPLRLHRARVTGDWLDYNGHMTEFRYLQVMGDATDALLLAVGIDAAHRAAGGSVYTVETHIRHLAEARAGDLLSVETRLLGHDPKRLHVHHALIRDDGTVCATGEHMLLHVDTGAGRAAPMPAPIRDRLAALAAADSAPAPAHAGAAVRRIG